ncbi:MAG: exodeoxyribonuclease VII small subunit [Oscillospiraceae bacterium]|nr:exodeoxyribonuclease VII small subunit [Oscillospiraceae bacterium]
MSVAEQKSFESCLGRLDEIVRRLEKGDLPLSESLSLFEEGTGLLAACTRMLDEAEQKVVKIRKGPDRQPEEIPFVYED